MHTANYQPKTSISVNNSYESESIEEKMRRAVMAGEPIEAISPMIFTERKDGVRPETDIRTDRFEVALLGMNHVNMSRMAKREEAENKNNETTEKTA